MKTNKQATIIDIQPKVFPEKLKRIWLTVIGTNFTPEADVVLVVDHNRYPIPKNRILFIDSNLMQISVFLSKREQGLSIEVNQNSQKPYMYNPKPTKPLATMIRY